MRYHLVFPGAARRVRAGRAARHLVEACGPRLDRRSLRLPPAARLPRVLRLIRRRPGRTCWRPAIPGSPGLLPAAPPPGPLPRPAGLLLPQRSHAQLPGALGRPRRLPRRASACWSASSLRLFYALQRGYDLTAVSSRAMEDALRGARRAQRGPPALRRARFLPGTSPSPSPGSRGRRFRLLYAGRLDREKGVDLLLEVLPALLESPSAPGVRFGGRARGLCGSVRRVRASPLRLPGLPGRRGDRCATRTTPMTSSWPRAPSRPSASACWRPWHAASWWWAR